MTFSAKHARRSALVLATQGSEFSASDIGIMPLLHGEFQDSLLAGLTDVAFTTNLVNYTDNSTDFELTDFEMEDFEEGPHFISDCPHYEAMVLSSWTTSDSGDMRLFAELPDVDHNNRQAWIEDDNITLRVRAERVVPSQGAICLPESVQLTADGSHEVFEAGTLLPLGFDFSRIVLRETDAGLEFFFATDGITQDDVEADSPACLDYEHMEVADWNLLPSGEFELEAHLPAVEPEHSKVQLSEDGTALHVHAWRAMTVHEECFPEGTQTAISGDGQYEIFERVVLLPFQVDTRRMSFEETPQGFRVTVPALIIENERHLTESMTSDQSEEEDANPEIIFDSREEYGSTVDDILDEFSSSLPDLCPSYHPLQVSPWRMTLAGFQLVVAVPGLDGEEVHTTLDERAHRLQVRASRPVPKEGLLCLPITTQVSADGSQELFDILIMMPYGSGGSFIAEDFEHGVKITIPFLASPLQGDFGLSMAPALDPPRKLADVLSDALKFAIEESMMEEQHSSLEEPELEQEIVDEIIDSESFANAEDSKLGCPEYQAMTSQDWQIVEGRFVLDVTMPGVLLAMRKAEFTEDGFLHISGFRSISVGNLLCLPLQAVTTVSLTDGLQEVLDAKVAMPLGGDATRVTKQNTEFGLQLRMPIIADGAQEIMKPHEV